MSKVSSAPSKPVRFGCFSIHRELCRDGMPVDVTPKALAVLRALVSRAGELVTKQELWEEVWPRVVVTDAALTMCIAEVRRVLGDDARNPRYIATVPKRGYRFVATLQTDAALPPGGSVADVEAEALPKKMGVIGREAELGALRAALVQARAGRRQLVFLTGAPGIGKTTLLDSFKREFCSSGEAAVISGQCSEYFGPTEPFLPLLDGIGRACRGDDGEALVELLNRYAPLWVAQLPSLAADADPEALQRRLALATPERMLRELAEALEVLAADKLVILTIEDMHWSDHATIDWLAFVARRDAASRLLVIATYRDAPSVRSDHPLREVTPSLLTHRLCREIALNPLSTGAIKRYLSLRVAGASGTPAGDELPGLDELVARFEQRTGGNPLYVANIADALSLDGGGADRADEVRRASEALREPVLPAGLRQSIASQIDKLSSEEINLLETSSVVGDSFSTAAVAAALEWNEAQTDAACERLARETGLIHAVGLADWPDGTLASRFTFRHSLYREVLYARISPGRMARLHSLVGHRLERAFANRVHAVAAELAMHLSRGHEHLAAARFSLVAGRTALSRAAYIEAEAHLQHGLAQLAEHERRTAPSESSLEFELQLSLGQTMIAVRGWASPEAEQAFARAHELRESADDEDARFTAHWGVAAGTVVRADFASYRRHGEQLTVMARRSGSAMHTACAHWALGQGSFHAGDYAFAVDAFESAFSCYERVDLTEQIRVIGMDFGVWTLSYLSHAQWSLGKLEQARTSSRAACELAVDVDHPFSTTIALNYAATLQMWLGDIDAAQRHVADAIGVCEAQGFSYYLGWATFLSGLIHRSDDNASRALADMRRGLDMVDASAARLRRAYYLALIAEQHLCAGSIPEAQAVAAAADEEMARTQERCWQPELYRIEGALAEQTMPNNAEKHYRNAICAAREQGALSWELHVALPLARLLKRQHRKQEARKLLVGIHERFDEGFERPVMQEASALIDALG